MKKRTPDTDIYAWEALLFCQDENFTRSCWYFDGILSDGAIKMRHYDAE
ncbi:hypothetical protein [Iodidimonas muriae]|nr:hypothetical protein [Iodidimonas muriae]